MLRLPDDWVWDSWIAQDGEHLPPLLPQGAARARGPDAAARPRHHRARHVDRPRGVDRPRRPRWPPRPTAGTTSRCGPGRRCAPTTAAGGCSTPRSTPPRARPARPADRRRRVRRPAHLAHVRRTGRSSPPTRAGTGRSTRTAAPARPGATRSCSATPTATAGTCWSPRACATPTGTTTACSPTPRSHDLVSWEVRPPVTGAPSGFGQVEVPQVRVVDGRPVLVFTCHPEEQSDARKAEHGLWCTWSVAGEPGGSLLGPWDLSRAVPFRPEPTLFAAPLVQAPDGGWALRRVPQPGAGGDPLLRDHRPGAGARRGRRPAGPLTLWKPLRYWIARSDLRVTDNHPMSESCPSARREGHA